MGKRRDEKMIGVSSDDDDDEQGKGGGVQKCKSRALVTRTNPKPHINNNNKKKKKKKPRISTSPSLYTKNVGFPSEDFDEFFYGSQVSAGSKRSNPPELWVHKYKPSSLEQLAVHSKKVEEVKSWFEERLISPKNSSRNCVLIITGQAGIGKSTTIQLIASHYGARVFEWSTPTPTIWQEHLHNSITGIQYNSKLDEFINFIEKVTKYGLIPSSFPGDSKAPIILVVDDIPVTNGRVAFERLRNSLLLLVRSTCIPTVILVTDYGKADSEDINGRFLEELQLSLATAGACKIAFNPVTNNSIKKRLTRICILEQCDVNAEQIELLAKTSGGDIRSAVTSLQLFCSRQDMVHSSASNLTLSLADGKSDEVDALVNGFSLLFGRDESLSLFHALGKFLHNKRETEVCMGTDQVGFLVRQKFSRLPLKMDAPEKILCQAHGQARPIADFLHENVLDFVSDEAIDDAWDVASYLSDADVLLSSFRGVWARCNEVDNVLQSAAASIAVRGVLFGNSHPLPSRWHAIRKPKLWQVERSMLYKQKEILGQRCIHGGFSSFHLSDLATEFTFVFKWLGHRAFAYETVPVHAKESERDGDIYKKMSLDNEDTYKSDDDIEDWTHYYQLLSEHLVLRRSPMRRRVKEF